MIARAPQTVLELMELNPDLTVYQYTQHRTQQVFYALFAAQTVADLDAMDDTRRRICLCEHGQMTSVGRAFVTEYGRRT